ncbi:MAG: hypothetical protein JXQ90_05485 [Cyclobacteriaceae bacterium]
MKFRLIISSICLVGLLGTLSASGNTLEADSLFAAKKYTEAYELYELIYLDGNASPAMLTKMAFIQEGLQNHEKALFFLSKYYELTSNKKALRKMAELAESNHLTGYEYADTEFLLNIIHRQKALILLISATLCLFILFLAWRKKNRNESMALPGIFQAIVLSWMLMVINDFFIRDKAIIWSERTLLMDGPSGAAEPLEIVQKGHKVTILEEADAWLKIEWNNQEAFIRKTKVRVI